MTSTIQAPQVSQQVIGFSQFLKEHDFLIGVNEITDSLLLLDELKQPNKQLTKHYFRSLFCNNIDQWQQFHELFDLYWDGLDGNITGDTKTYQSQTRFNTKLSGLAGYSQEENSAKADLSSGVGAGKQNTIGKADFRFLNDPQAMQEVEHLAETLAHQLKRTIKRKKKIAAHGNEINFRHTIRASLPSGTIAAKPRFNLIKREPPSIVILHDVSHSMTWNNPLLFRFVRGLVNAFQQTEAFVFHTRLNHVTDVFKSHSIPAMKQKLEATNNLWLGGTCIALSIETFNKQYAPSMLNKKTTVILISDGFDTDSPAKLITQLNLLKTRAEKVFWLNPMLGREGYQADSNTRAVRPFVDSMLPAHSLDSLRQVINRLK